MCSSSSSTPIFFPLHIPCTNHHFIKLSYPFPSPRKHKIISLSSSLTQDNIQLSWASSDRQNIQDYNGWAFVEQTDGSKTHTKGLPTFVLFGIGTSVVALLAVFARFTLSRKGFVLRFSGPFHVSVENKSLGSEDGLNVDEGFDEPLIENVDEEVDVITKEVNGHGKWEEGKPGRVVVPVSADATQQEALSWLKNLKVFKRIWNEPKFGDAVAKIGATSMRHGMQQGFAEGYHHHAAGLALEDGEHFGKPYEDEAIAAQEEFETLTFDVFDVVDQCMKTEDPIGQLREYFEESDRLGAEMEEKEKKEEEARKAAAQGGGESSAVGASSSALNEGVEDDAYIDLIDYE